MSILLPNGKKIISIPKETPACHTMPPDTKLECLAHELGHCMTDAFYRGYSPFERRSKHERRANNWATEQLIPFSELCNAVKDGYRELWELAEYFDVSCAFVEKAIQIHKLNGNIVPPELYEEY